MQIVIIGDGSVGDILTSFICNEGHNVTVIDEDARVVDSVVNKYDVMGIVGNGSNVDVQKQAGVPDCDVLIAVTHSDELNLIACMIGRKLGAKHSIARVRDPEYLKQRAFMCNNLGIDMIVNPEYEAAREAARLIRFPAAMKLEKFAQGQVEVVDILIDDDHPLIGLKLMDMRSKYSTNVLVCAVRHGDSAIIPGGDYVISKGDFISVTASRRDIADFFSKIGFIGKHIKKVMLIGGGRVSRYLADQLSQSDYKVKIIESDGELCEELAESLPKVVVINADPSDPDILVDEGLDSSDACVAMTRDDKTNIIISMFAKSHSVEKVITQISSPTFAKLSGTTQSSNIAPKFLTVSKVIQYIRGIDNLDEEGSKSGIKTLYKIADNLVEALEFDVADDFEALDIPLKDLKLKKNLLIAAIIRDNSVIYPNGQSVIRQGDSVVVVTASERLYDLGDILA